MSNKKYVNGVLVDMTADEITARQAEETEWTNGASARNLKELRFERNLKLAETDWVVIKEREEGGSVSNFADWKTYRQSLRDITDSATSLDDVTWPEKP
jgi:hypothetical protein